MKLRTIHIGVGGRGQWPFKMAGENPAFLPVALVDTQPENLESARALAGLPAQACHADAEKALREVEADAVLICTPTTLHAPFCRLAFAHGKHVLVEKPMTNNWEEAKALVSEAAAAGVKFCVVQNVRYYPAYRAAASILQDPSHDHHPGEVRLIDFMQHRNRPNPRNQVYPLAMVWDMGVHHMDTLIALSGPLESVVAHTYAMPWSLYQHPTNINAVIRFANGAVCNYLLTHDSRHPDLRVVLQGERGSLRYTGLISSAPSELFFHPAGSNKMADAQACAFPALRDPSAMVMDDFCRYIETGQEPKISGSRNLETLRACQMLCRSAIEDRAVRHSEVA